MSWITVPSRCREDDARQVASIRKLKDRAMKTRTNYYKGLAADYSQPSPVEERLASELIRKAENYIALKQDVLPDIGPDSPLTQSANENEERWRPPCEAHRTDR